ncbi:MAG: GNAT family N-acetyltransferase [Actinomycetota bacterium]|nr:GNAT family N-acetyltransferase [Actinomycetota bacterium]
MGVVVRPAALGDEAGMGAVHVAAWLAAYRGLMPDEYLDSLTVEQRTEMWRQGLERELRPGFGRFVAESAEGVVIGFVIVGPESGADGAARGEVFAINVDPSAWVGGAGSRLLTEGVSTLAAQGWPTAVLWVHPANARARGFYERRGWAADGAERIDEVLGVVVPEVRYTRSLP